jgi:hypothetical protein
MRGFLRGYRTLMFNFTLVTIGIIQKLQLDIPDNVVIVAHELLHAVGIQNVDGSTLISIGVAGILLRTGTSTPVGRRV